VVSGKLVYSPVIASIETNQRFARAEPGVTAPHVSSRSTNSTAYVFNPAQSRVISKLRFLRVFVPIRSSVPAIRDAFDV